MRLFFDNPDSWCIQPDLYGGKDFALDMHSIRESLLALTGLIRRRNSVWAEKIAHRMLETIQRAARDDGEWNFEQFVYFRKCSKLPDLTCHPTGTSGRAIEALVLYYEATGDELAFQLAERFARWHFEHSIHEDGTIAGIPNLDHTHSFLGTLRGLFLFGKLAGRRNYIDKVKQCYQKTVRTMIKESGYSSHDIGYEKQQEPASAGDAAQLALWFALDGSGGFLDDAERIVRARILPSQVTKTPPLIPAGSGGDQYERLEERVLGGFGGMHFLPHGGKRNTTDVTAACLHTLADIYNHIVWKDASAIWILFHFTYADRDIQIKECRGEAALLQIQSYTAKPLMIRIPGWVAEESLKVKINGEVKEVKPQEGFLRIPGRETVQFVEVAYDLPEKIITETTNGVDYRIAWRGDEITGISPNTTWYPFYPNL